MSNQSWKTRNEVGNQFWLNMLVWFALNFGRSITRILLIPITSYFYLRRREERKASRDYLYRILGRNPHWTEIFRHFYYFTCVTIDRLFLLAGKFDAFSVRVYGGEVFDMLRRNQRGCLLFVSHLGSFDVMRIPGVKEQALPINILMDVDHNPKIMQLIMKFDPDLAGHLINVKLSKPELVLKINDIIEQSGMMGMMIDRLYDGDEGVCCTLLGADARLPAGPWYLAAVLKVPVVLCFGLYHGRNQYSIYFELFDSMENCQKRSSHKAISGYIQEYCLKLEHYLNLEPFNWFNFYEFWKNKAAGN